MRSTAERTAIAALFHHVGARVITHDGPQVSEQACCGPTRVPCAGRSRAAPRDGLTSAWHPTRDRSLPAPALRSVAVTHGAYGTCGPCGMLRACSSYGS